MAIEETTGIVAVSGNEIIDGDFHALSAGMTRDGFAHVKQVTCPLSMEADDFLTQLTFAKDQIGSIAINAKDSAGYITEPNWNGHSYTGEYLR